MATDKLFIGVDKDKIELLGEDKESFLTKREVFHQAYLDSMNLEIQKQAARQSALAKLAALGLTEEEIAAL